MRFGVVRFPGSCDEVDALLACRRFADAELLWHGDRDLKGVDAVVIPGGFSYGDYLRCGRHRPLLARDGGGQRVRARTAGRCSGSATASRCSARPACCPARCCPTRGGGSSAARSTSRWSTPPRRSRAPATRATCSRSRSSTRPAATTRQRRLSASWTHTGRSSSATREGHNPNGSALDIAGVCNRAKNVMGLMPHPEHAVDPLTGSADGGLPVRVARRARRRARRRRERRPPPHRELGLTDSEYDLIVRQARPRAQRPRAGGVLADVVRALRLQALEEAARPAAHRGAAPADGPGRERGRGDRRGRPGDRVQGRVAQPPERG